MSSLFSFLSASEVTLDNTSYLILNTPPGALALSGLLAQRPVNPLSMRERAQEEEVACILLYVLSILSS
jgi:hypothetical protein